MEWSGTLQHWKWCASRKVDWKDVARSVGQLQCLGTQMKKSVSRNVAIIMCYKCCYINTKIEKWLLGFTKWRSWWRTVRISVKCKRIRGIALRMGRNWRQLLAVIQKFYCKENEKNKVVIAGGGMVIMLFLWENISMHLFWFSLYSRKKYWWSLSYLRGGGGELLDPCCELAWEGGL